MPRVVASEEHDADDGEQVNVDAHEDEDVEDGREALEERYSIPYIWIAVAGDEYVRVGLTPRLAWAIDAQAQASVRRLPELEGVLGWLERLPTEETEEVRVRTSKISLTLAKNLYERLELQQESVE